MIRPFSATADQIAAALGGRLTQVRHVPRKAHAMRLVCKSCGATEREYKSGRCPCPGAGDLDWVAIGPMPYRTGDRLWVRERLVRAPDRWTYAADGADVPWPARRCVAGHHGPSMPTLTMPRDTSRIVLDVVGVRLARLGDMTDEDAVAEGAHLDEGQWTMGLGTAWPGTRDGTAVQAVREAWAMTRGPGAWAEDAWTAILGVRVRLANVEHLV